ncbi:conserved Plasmodium protein, unknown function [Plasmodium knowlesi strain H]|uniref:Uncharacterized protein n=3 Tax=Plasmodium knowlesi TaxID=5850 RepID=A0A5K1VQY5_PLAKH|nr:conserved Plasmodium protein, unknown function [Plasmodium knowlesi strain H]OTN64277.1 Uncharacterized protein PKNOH_S140240200 [Plasmodium knowlesi]CAA9990824.1 conserved Plasmodium protein, unknown function [Plasmodium knowlesi strain H]SBO20996.1 conserved Plasmodium protein, unknown function [Plasmodium knowlesi strain H]SBO21490.1 conserved Plasmodium protein, unknown function [Plasmodium knowlesi strain H]VVS80298.1 conserved Plasmodium protein, unknown function [Plasmodium knowlesi |eukprot:XP_002262112.1 hypothetical protein, conserved in Plasmodium species [Plasmodium knowlesi strain H]
MDTLPDVESAFLIYNFENSPIRNAEKSNIIKQFNNKIKRHEKVLLNSHYKHVNNFSYSTDIFHNFYKITEYYLLKYVNSIIIDSTLFFKCVHQVKNGSSYLAQNDEEKLQERFCLNEQAEEGTKLLGNSETKNEDPADFTFDCVLLRNFVENFKRVNSSSVRVSKTSGKENRRGSSHKKYVSKDANGGSTTNNAEANPRGGKEEPQNYPFRKSFLYELCEVYSHSHNKKKRMICITKIFRKIVSRKQIRQFICENDKRKKKNYLRFFLNLSLGIFIYLYMHKYIKKNYRNVEFFIFLNSPQNFQDIYVNMVPQMEKQQICSFIKFVKLLNIRMFRYLYITFFVNIYKYVNLIYNVTLLTLYSYFKYLNECINGGKELFSLERQEQIEEGNHLTEVPTHIRASHTALEGTSSRREKREPSEIVTNEDSQGLSLGRTMQNYGSGLKESVDTKSTAPNIYQNYERVNSEIGEKNTNELNNKREAEDTSTWNGRQYDNPGPANYSEKHTHEIILSCYIYLFIFYHYIRETRKKMKYEILRIQNDVKKMIALFLKIYGINKKGSDDENRTTGECKKDGTIDLRRSLTSSANTTQPTVDSVHSLYFNFIQMSKCYRRCVKTNYELIKSVHTFHLLLKHFYKYFPILNVKKDKCMIYNYWNKHFIHYAKRVEKNGQVENVFCTEEKNRQKGNGNPPLDVFKNVNDYEMDFFYFHERKKEEEEIIIDLVQKREEENLDHLFGAGKGDKVSSPQFSQIGEEAQPLYESEGKNEQKDEQKVEQKDEQKDEQKGEQKGEQKDEQKNEEENDEADDMEPLKRLFLNCVNNGLDALLLNAGTELGGTAGKMERDGYASMEHIPDSGNIFPPDDSHNGANFSSLRKSPILQLLRSNIKIYRKIDTMMETFSSNKLEGTIKNCLHDLNKYNKSALDIYDDCIFDIQYKIEKEPTLESEELRRNKKLLQVKIFLDYEKLYTKKTVETQTPVSFFRKEKVIQIPKDEGVSTTSEQYIQAKRVANPIFYLKDIYD